MQKQKQKKKQKKKANLSIFTENVASSEKKLVRRNLSDYILNHRTKKSLEKVVFNAIFSSIFLVHFLIFD